jgi:hypothetical protein
VNVTGQRATHTLEPLSGEPGIALHILKEVHRQTLRFYRQSAAPVNLPRLQAVGRLWSGRSPDHNWRLEHTVEKRFNFNPEKEANIEFAVRFRTANIVFGQSSRRVAQPKYFRI